MIRSVPPQIWYLAAVAAALFFAARNLPPALLCLFPRLLRTRETDDDRSLDDDQSLGAGLARIASELAALGFRRLGAIEIHPPLSAGRAEILFGAVELHTFADVDAHGGALRVTLYTPFSGGEGVLTSSYQRPAYESPTLLIGGLPKHDVRSLLAVHRRRVASLQEGGTRSPWPDITVAGRIAADAVFAGGAGGRELRVRAVRPLMIVLIALGCAAISALQLLRLK